MQILKQSSFILVLSGMLLTGCNKIPAVDIQTQLSVDSGELVGFSLDDNIYAWLGIPYAAPPLGELRWKAPQPVAPWDGVRQALAYGPSCVQPPNMTSGDNAPESERIVGVEDCLTLNVFVPKDAFNNSGNVEAEALPVMVWIHGGANIIGSAQYYEPVALAAKHPVIVVSINYRLGLFGWLSHEMLRGEGTSPEDQSGNYGTLDIIEALKWVQNNITQFGGDSNRVTIFGESAGGRNVWSLMASPLAKGLFHRAIAQSGSLHLMDAAKAEQHDKSALDYPGFRNTGSELVSILIPNHADLSPDQIAAEMRSLSPDEVYNGVPFDLGGMYTQPRLFLDGYVFPESSLTLFENPASYNSVPVITGSNRDEDKLFMAFDGQWTDMRWGFLPELKDPDWYNLAVSFSSDTWRALSVDLPARVITENGGAPVYTYRFDYDEFITWPVDLKTLLGAAHGLEVAFLFDGQSKFPMNIVYGDSESADSLSDAMRNYWVEFAYTGNPGRGHDGRQPLWTRWQEERPILILDSVDDGGIRMDSQSVTVDMIKRRLETTTMRGQKEKCDAYLQMFLNGYQIPIGFDESEYASFADGGCPVH